MSEAAGVGCVYSFFVPSQVPESEQNSTLENMDAGRFCEGRGRSYTTLGDESSRLKTWNAGGNKSLSAGHNFTADVLPAIRK